MDRGTHLFTRLSRIAILFLLVTVALPKTRVVRVASFYGIHTRLQRKKLPNPSGFFGAMSVLRNNFPSFLAVGLFSRIPPFAVARSYFQFRATHKSGRELESGSKFDPQEATLRWKGNRRVLCEFLAALRNDLESRQTPPPTHPPLVAVQSFPSSFAR